MEEEQDSAADGAVGPCMEYMLQHRVLDTLYTFARTDVRDFLDIKSFLPTALARKIM